jgi:putative sigma-54 modulation protein
MKIIIKGTDLDLTEPLKEYINQRILSLDKIISGFEKNGEIMINVEVARSTKHHNKGEVFYAEFTLQLAGHPVRIEQYGKDVREAIDFARERLKNELVKQKEIVQSKRDK